MVSKQQLKRTWDRNRGSEESGHTSTRRKNGAAEHAIYCRSIFEGVEAAGMGARGGGDSRQQQHIKYNILYYSQGGLWES